MTSDPPADIRRKRILYRATHRGTKEADAVVGGFFTDRIAQFPEDQLDEAEALLEAPDPDLMDWVMERCPLPERSRGPVMDQLFAYYRALTTRAG